MNGYLLGIGGYALAVFGVAIVVDWLLRINNQRKQMRMRFPETPQAGNKERHPDHDAALV